jgi:hypothetical protein
VRDKESPGRKPALNILFGTILFILLKNKKDIRTTDQKKAWVIREPFA